MKFNLMWFAWFLTMIALFSTAYKYERLKADYNNVERSCRVQTKVHNRLVRCVNQNDTKQQIIKCVWKQK